MGRHVILDEQIGGWDTLITEPRSFTYAANAAEVAGHGARWVAARAVPAVVGLAGLVWLAVTIIWWVGVGLLVFVAIPAAVALLRAVAAAYNDVGGL
jgi:hypothetical protein